MDTIELKKYYRTGGLVDEKTTSPKDLLNKIKTTFGNATLTKDGLTKRPTEFYEFFINGRPLSAILKEFCKLDNSILDNWVGVLGAFTNIQSELNTIKRLLLKQITEQEIREAFPKDLDKHYLDDGIENYNEELADEEILIYCCAECGDYGCGGYKVKVDASDDSIVWTYSDEGKILQFHFDKHQYFQTFDTYRQTIINENNSR
ncbi:hypothetical protein DSECCO2_579920 [anaerobic digester metagenome]